MKRNQTGKNNPNWRGGVTGQQHHCKQCGLPIHYLTYLKTGLCVRCGKKGINASKENGMWKGDKVGYGALHIWISDRKPKPKTCPKCRKITTKLELANISQKYKRDIQDFEWLCRRCHMLKDGRMNKLIIRIISRNRRANGI